jgi:hypothetical protein
MLEDTQIDCPYCGENFDLEVDCSAGGQQYIEDCPVCCQPIEISTSIDIEGNLQDVQAHRNDD